VSGDTVFALNGKLLPPGPADKKPGSRRLAARIREGLHDDAELAEYLGELPVQCRRQLGSVEI
jgi:hypothetical protein